MDPNRLIASLQRSRAALKLDTADLCYLVALRARAERAALASFEEDLLVDVFEQICEITDPGAENPRKRATHAIQRLREQRLLARVDGAGLVRAGEYTLTRLAAAVVDFFFDDEALTRESLTLLTGVLAAQLVQVLGAARSAATAEAWRAEVVAPLQITVRDLVAGIERRQRGLDLQQEEIRERIGALLQSDWFRAVETCEELLEATASTLRELNEVLLRDTGHIQARLQEIEQLAADRGTPEAAEAAQRAAEHVDRVSAWGRDRQRAWSEYYQYVQRFLRDVVRLDRDRALSQRLRDQLVAWPDRPFALIAARAPSIRLLRPLEARVARPPVVQPRGAWRTPLEEQPPDPRMADQELRVRAALAAGAATLSEVLTAVLPGVSEEHRFVAVGRIAAQLAAEARPRSALDPPWVEVPGELSVEEWSLMAAAPDVAPSRLPPPAHVGTSPSRLPSPAHVGTPPSRVPPPARPGRTSEEAP
ncbi:chromosome partition protein MukF [Sorangium cellulosum]|uniref:Chromosome partition protein MukF n=1 Tax=Sorangium cellulosum TaxID=56 RepID=A0A150PVY7_SORCE|nr:chromosome partition protein MukF [Sorangium cellulosum]